MKQLALAAAGALMLGGLAIPASAAPVVGADLKAAATGASSIEQAHYYRRCWHRYGRLVCPRVVRRYYRSYAYSPYYDDGYYGYGYGPGIGLYFGGGGFRGGHFGGHHRR